ncbi:MAG: N-acetylneuraminate synthase family protein [Myxococcota bacterium]|nr:N-acetylneuraminate synthase family protein [Myxococcota bacterium]
MRIANHDITERILIVAEIGNNHEGNFEVACRMLEAAADAGVDAVKFQTFQTRLFTSKADPARFERLTKFELTQTQFRQLAELAKKRGIIFFSTPLDLESARFLEPLVDVFKVASGDNNFIPLIQQVAATGKPLIISTGLADLAHLHRISELARDAGAEGHLAFLHCVCAYPAPPAEANLRAIPMLAAELGVPIGWSDHTLGFEASLAAAALGARIIEKHFTLDKNFSAFRDHQLSADPAEMRLIVDGVRKIEQLLGKPEKRVQPCEEANQRPARRSIAAARDLPRGHVLVPADLVWVRPAIGLPPGEERQLLARTLTRDVPAGDAIRAEDVD